MLGAWALAACSAEETATVEAHLTDCAPCADEALRLRDAVGLLHPEDNLDLDPRLRSQVLAGCLDRRPARVPVPEWAAPYDAETARLDALLRDMGEAEWRAPVQLAWFDGRRSVSRDVPVAEVLSRLTRKDGLVGTVLGLGRPPGGATAPDAPGGRRPTGAGETAAAAAGSPGAGEGDGAGAGDGVTDVPSGGALAYRSPGARGGAAPPPGARRAWREQTHALVRAVSLRETHGLTVPYSGVALPLSDSFLERAFACWVRAWDIAEAVDYPYAPPLPAHLHRLIDLTARLLPGALTGRRRAGPAERPPGPAAIGSPARTLHLEVEGSGGGDWYIPLDPAGAPASGERAVAHVALDGTEFCRLAAGRIPPEEAAAGQEGDRRVIHDVLTAAAALSRLQPV
ncbi:hypothetical protein HCK00_04985 [Streptomyces sp. PLAI1-29]|uniref:MDMPI N domain containing protein n=1 Tax=Streptomyces zingiberis TaxID=2053010 RepID=A0ABX1BQE4_9ACTN|nr:hypothetical protein [Streptomyces zingiberis]